MKNLLLLTCICLSTHLFTQTTQWLLPGASWNYSYASLGGYGSEILEYAGTETIGGELCVKLHRHGFHFGTPLGQGTIDYGYEFLFTRNDSVFLWDQNTFKLLYDFTRQAGDTMWLTNSPNKYAVVQAIGDTSWQGIPVRYQDWLLVYPNFGSDTFFTPTRVYERLGGHHLIYWNIESPLTEIYYTLDCYSDEEYPNLTCIPDSSYNYFPLKKATWSEEDGLWCGYGGFQYVMNGDTTVPGYNLSKKLYYRPTYQGAHPCPTATAKMLNEPLVLIGAISQDLIGKKVYYTAYTAADVYPRNFDAINYPFQPGVTTLLYDFDLSPAQELDWKPEPNTYVFSDSILLNDGSRRRRLFFLDENAQFDSTYYWIEGIGGSHGLFTAFVNPNLVDVYSGLRCFKEQNELLINHVPVEYCDSIPITISAPEQPSLEEQIRLFPNPASTQVNLEIPNDALPAVLRMYDPLGRVLKTVDLENPHTTIPIEMRGQHWLLIQIRSHDGRVAGKKVKM